MAYPQRLATGSEQRDAGHDGSRADIAWRRAVKRLLGRPRLLCRFGMMPVANVQGLIRVARYRRR
jgi:hypothetical protein